MADHTQTGGGTERPPPVSGRKRGRLERTLGLPEALTIGVGTMVGAGIFIFPGLAVAEAGPAAALSFVLGAGVALLVALPTSELATAMPRSGGGYFFVSRALGTKWGTIVGLGQWLGLVFASAFYLAGFGHYLADGLARLGVPMPISPGVVGFLTALALTAVAIVGTRTSGRLQYVIVVVLVALLGLVLAWGVGTLAWAPDRTTPPDRFAPAGVLPVFTTAALVFTSYLGFAQIANVAGEVVEPSRTLPRAMLGSVVVVGALYVLTILVSTGVMGTEAMAEAGETAMTELGSTLLGGLGAAVVGVAGLLATLSSANASILSSSRAVFATSRDGVLPEGASAVSRRFRTPHLALLLAGVPIALLTLLGRLEILAEVASLLHLVMYGLICLSVVALRRSSSLWYRPTFRAPGGWALPVVGAVLCFGLVAFMDPTSIAWGAVVLAAAAAWYVVRARGISLRGVDELAPAPEVAQATLLLQMEVPDPPGVPDQLIRALAPERVVLLGWTQVPEQSDPEQVRDEVGEEAEADLESTATELTELGMTTDTELVFTGDLVRTIDRMALEREADAVLSLRPIERVDRILVALGDAELAREAAGYAARIARATGARVEAIRPEEGGDEGKAAAERLRRRFLQTGLRGERFELLPDEGEVDADRILEAAEGADLVILREKEPEEEERTFGGLAEEVTRRADVPVLIVRSGAEPADPGEVDA